MILKLLLFTRILIRPGVRANGVHRVLDGQLQRLARFLDVDAERALELGFHDLIIDQK